jgi:succinate dehydrogenase flavin-adding protein (antitoxin of CptAB toxin-antitoxin module)
MRELDILLADYLDREYPHADEQQKQAFRELLSLSDPELIAYLLGGETPQDSTLVTIVRTIRDRPHA